MELEAEVRKLYIDNAIHLIATGGFEKATTKELTHCGGNLPGLKMNEVYLYRLFGSKENLYEAAFLQLDEEVYVAFKSGLNAVGGFADYSKEKMEQFFRMAWKFLLQNEEKFRCYVRYYYSIYLNGRSLALHEKRFDRIAAEFMPLFKEEVDVNALLHSVFSALLDFAVCVYNGQLINNEINRPHIYNVLYCMMMTYFVDSAKVS